jgi:hypothetical protein
MSSTLLSPKNTLRSAWTRRARDLGAESQRALARPVSVIEYRCAGVRRSILAEAGSRRDEPLGLGMLPPPAARGAATAASAS